MVTTFAVKHLCFSCHNGNKTHKFLILLFNIITKYLFLKNARKNTIIKGTIKLDTEQIFNAFFNEDMQTKGVAEQ